MRLETWRALLKWLRAKKEDRAAIAEQMAPLLQREMAEKRKRSNTIMRWNGLILSVGMPCMLMIACERGADDRAEQVGSILLLGVMSIGSWLACGFAWYNWFRGRI